MTTVILSDLKSHLRLDQSDTSEDELLTMKLASAEDWIARWIGKPLADFDPVPASIVEAVLQVTAAHYESREGYGDGVPEETLRLLSPHREWSF
ncbi:head-tail connector protein [Jiella avicenniae]|uniref:Head-tail connector protein n=1 Tax=Jiella avicenniae TaxID=2907202 RepID=A0A9X1P1S0_9HYPH|nr:head-tail connector protein [Jiella avicenniae]MCE7028928.1 head-tail connector protein [Jiella avicenniae]